jgi:hypothetical protein
MSDSTTANLPLHGFLAGFGRDARGRSASDVLAFSDERLEAVHDYIQWLFPLPTRSAAQPDAPILSAAEIEAIRADAFALATVRRAADRMLQFYRETDGWLVANDHNHLRITRIITSLRILLGDDASRAFYEGIMAHLAARGSPVSPRNRDYWDRALSI